MIKELNEVEMRRSGVIYHSSLEQIRKLFKLNPQQAGELAIMIIEITLTGQHSSDDKTLDIMVQTTKAIAEKDEEKYENKKAINEQNKISGLKLDVIADYLKEGCTQVEIGRRLGLSKQTVNYRVKRIKEEYGYLLKNEEDQILTDESKILTESKSQMESKSKILTNQSKNLTENFDGQINELDLVKNELQNSGQKVKQVKNNDNDNVNDNVNVRGVFPNGKTGQSILPKGQNLQSCGICCEPLERMLEGGCTIVGEDKEWVYIQGLTGLIQKIHKK